MMTTMTSGAAAADMADGTAIQKDTLKPRAAGGNFPTGLRYGSPGVTLETVSHFFPLVLRSQGVTDDGGADRTA